MSKTPATPSYRHHKPSGQAVVTLNGKDFYLGPYDTDVSRRAYDRLIAEWLANGRKLPRLEGTEIKVVELIDRYLTFAATYYRKNGVETTEVSSIKQALRPVNKLYADVDVSAFGPAALKAVQVAMIGLGWSRRHINQQVSRVRRMVLWGVENELVNPSVFGALKAVSGLKRGRTEARDTNPIGPVPESVVEATIEKMNNRHVVAMVRLQLLTGMRPGEVLIMRTMDIDTTGELWEYRPYTHKMEHKGKERVIMLGQKSQEIIRPFLRPVLSEYLFQPTEALEEHRQWRQDHRKAKRCYYRRKPRPRRHVRECYQEESYRDIISRYAERAGVPHWHPNQLRHTWATKIRKLYGLEAARVGLGHTSAETTLIYAERDLGLARKVAAEVG